MKRTTRLQHPDSPILSPDNPPLVAPLYQSVKFTLPGLEEVESLMSGKRSGYLYSRVANPTVDHLGRILGELQQRDGAELFSSGVAAITALLFGLLRAGDHVICFYECYRPTRFILSSMLGKFGVQTSYLHVDELSRIESFVQSGKTKVLIFETPTNPVTRGVDIAFICDLAKRHGILTVCDNTFAGFHNHGRFPVDFFIHSLTKFAGGHGDVMGGIVLAARDTIRPLKEFFIDYGATLDPSVAHLFLRSMKTYLLRYQAQEKNAVQIAEWLTSVPQVQAVLYPGLTTHPDHRLFQRQMEGFGTIISVDLKGEDSAVRSFVRNLKLFQLTGSLGSTESLVAPSALFYGNDLSPEISKRAGIGAGTIRLSIGLEDPDDLKSDLLQALETPY